MSLKQKKYISIFIFQITSTDKLCKIDPTFCKKLIQKRMLLMSKATFAEIDDDSADDVTKTKMTTPSSPTKKLRTRSMKFSAKMKQQFDKIKRKLLNSMRLNRLRNLGSKLVIT